MRQFLWLYLRAWVWARLPGWPRLSAARWGWLALGAVGAASLAWQQEIWPHTPGAALCAGAGLGLAGLGSGALVLRGLWHWLWAWVQGWRGPGRVLGLAVLLLAGALGLLVGLVAVVLGGLVYALAAG